ncbi:MAG: hypothetical protein IPH12_16245 [Saprospirales bacterium]|jgi:hypothetical protein|nr:hypothetical protein [Saprospirales bacterium]MBK8920132.1 hypothetical protein [Saprospirales bacterium]
MNKLLIKGFAAGAILLAFSYLALYLLVMFLPQVAEQYYNPIFDLEGDKTYLYFLHPFILSFALAWFWRRFKSLFHGPFWWRGMELGLVYALIATLPSMWITFSSLAVSFTLVATWFLYGLFQAVVIGIVYAKISP